jgi:CheY-like chemotaxis protein
LPTILIVEDEALVRLALLEYLEEQGFAVLEASNADEAVSLIKKAKLEPDLVFTDVRMPGAMDGLGLSRWLREQRPDIPVIVASGHAGIEDIAASAGEQFCAKPYQLDHVVSKIRARIAARGKA